MRPSIRIIARVCHEANRAWCLEHGDESHVPWAEAPSWQRESCLSGVAFVMLNPTAGDAAQHDEWCRVKRADGWVWGETKDPVAKTHPCLVPFTKLPPEQQRKGAMFRAIALALVGEVLGYPTGDQVVEIDADGVVHGLPPQGPLREA